MPIERLATTRRTALLRRGFPTRDPRVKALVDDVVRILDVDANVLLLGESGTGKDLLAELIHRAGKRAAGPFVKIDCANLPTDLFESELFGYERGAFTDARDTKAGKLELAAGGTIYFDQISGLDLHLQAKLLRVIQEKRFTHLGGVQPIALAARILASSNIDLEQAVAAGSFRSDLFYRLNVLSFRLPPLRERRDDVPFLAARFLHQAAERYRTPAAELAPDAIALLRDYRWPGNLRELRNLIERAAILAREPVVDGSAFPSDRFLEADHLVELAVAERWTLEQLEAAYIRETLRLTKNNRSRAAEILGINRKTLLEKRRRYRLP